MQHLHGSKIRGVLLASGLKIDLALAIKGSPFSPKLFIVMPKAQRAITSIVKAPNSLFF